MGFSRRILVPGIILLDSRIAKRSHPPWAGGPRGRSSGRHLYLYISDFKFIYMIVFIAIFSIITVDIKVEFSIDLHIY